MSRLLGDWLGPEIEKNLKDGVEWLSLCKEAKKEVSIKQEDRGDGESKISTTQRSVNARRFLGPEYKLLYENDGSNLRITVDRDERGLSCVQLVKVLSPSGASNTSDLRDHDQSQQTDPGIRVLLSDGHTSVPAKLSNTLIKTFKKQYGFSFVERAAGCIIAITGFKISATTYGPNEWQVYLDIEKLDWHGCGGSSTFGHPRLVRERDPVKALLLKLDTLLHGYQIPHQSQQDTELPEDIPVETAEGIELDNRSDSVFNTQTPLATQVSHHARSNSVEILGGANLSQPTQPGHSHRVTQQNVLRPPAFFDQRARLLNLLANRHAAEGALETKTRLHQPVPEPLPHVAQVASQPNSPKSIPTPPQKKECELHGNDPMVPAKTGHGGKNHDKLEPKAAACPEVERNSPVLNATIDITNSGSQHSRSEELMSKIPEVESKLLECFWMKSPITRRMCEISSEQQIILNREDAWIPSQPGRSFPGANIPIKVLNRLNSFTERQANGRHLSVADDSEQNGEPPEAQKSPSVSTAFDKHQSSDSDSDIPIRPKLAPELDDSKEPEHLSEAEASSISHMSWSPSLSPQPPMHHDDKVLPPDSSLHEEGVSEVTTPKRVDSPASLSSSSGRQLKSVSKTVSTTRRNTTRLMKSRHRGNSISPERLFNSGYLSQEVPGNSENSDMLDPLVLHSSPPTTTKDIMIVDISSSDDDLETSIPRALKQARRIGSSSTSPLPSSDKSRQPQSGVTQQISKLQVEETPYLLGRVKSRADTKPSTLSPGRQNPSSRSKDMTSSTSIIPSTYRDAQKPYPTGHRKLSTINIHSKAVPLLSDEEAMVDQQIEEDMKAPSQRQPTSPFDPSSSHSIVVQKTSIKPFESSLTNSLERSHSPKLIPHIVNQTKAPMAKREAEDLSAERLRQPKKFKTDYGFTQEEHSPQDAATKARESRRDFMTNFSKSKSRSEISPPAKARETISTDGNTKSHRTIDRTPELHSHRFAQNNEAVTLSPQSRFWTHSNQERRIQRATSSHDSLKERNIVDEGHGMTSAKVVSKIPYIARDHWSPSQEQISREDRISMLKDVRPLSRSTFPLLQQNAQISATSRQSAKTSRIAALYSKFAETYPDYRGDEKHFIGLCRMIDNLQKGEKMEHKSLWDDFIIRHKAEYSKYIVRCSEEGDDPVPYIKFYHDQIDEPAYTKRIMEPGILKSALDQYSASPAVLQSTPSSSIPARRQSNSPTTSRSPKRSRRSLPWAQPLPSSSASSTNRTRNSLPSGDHLRSKPSSQSLNRPCIVQDSARGANAMEEKNEVKWHEQKNTPFKEFVSGYVGLKSVEGRLGTVGADGTLRPPANAIDVLSWPFNRSRGAS